MGKQDGETEAQIAALPIPTPHSRCLSPFRIPQKSPEPLKYLSTRQMGKENWEIEINTC